jgi:hypothetical protein
MLTVRMQQRVREAVTAIHARGEYPSRRLVLRELGRSPKCNLTPEQNVLRLAEIRRLGLEVIIAKAGYR